MVCAELAARPPSSHGVQVAGLREAARQPLWLGAKLCLALCLTATGTAHATSGIPCRTADDRTQLNVLISNTQGGAGGGVSGLTLQSANGENTHLKVSRARVDYRRKTLVLSATDPVAPDATIHLRVRQAQGTLQLGGLRVALSCDWGDFS
ncbi:MAG: hypothetical protein Q7T87_05725 [Polaromonas sp.]|nr:hypothetical protein [Polaromonas sp.]